MNKTPPLLQNQSLVEWVMRRYHFDPFSFPEEWRQRLIDNDTDRASGLVVCEHCGLKYFDHPKITGIDGVVVTCDWRIYKL